MKEILIPGLIMIILDYFYLSITSNFYKNLIENIQKEKFEIKIFSTILVYIVLLFTVYFFVIKDKKSPLYAFLLGFCIYAIYELTNYSIFKKWTLKAVLLDTFWGGILFFLTTIITYKLLKIMV